MIASAFRLLSHFWLEEVKVADLDTIAALPELAQALPQTDPETLTGLAVEYQRLFGFNLPPYESVFVDPAVMLATEATGRVRRLYRQGGWRPPATVRAGAEDHLGVELLALADWLASDQASLASQLQVHHLALWVPAFVATLHRLNPHPFYGSLGVLTLELLLATLPEAALPAGADPFPKLPPLPDPYARRAAEQAEAEELLPPKSDEEEMVGLRDLIRRLLPPSEVGLFLTREDLARLGQGLGIPPVVGERFQMLEGLFKMAGQYELLPPLFDGLLALLAEASATYRAWAAEFPAWRPYAEAWGRRLEATQVYLSELKQLANNQELLNPDETL